MGWHYLKLIIRVQYNTLHNKKRWYNYIAKISVLLFDNSKRGGEFSYSANKKYTGGNKYERNCVQRKK